MKTFLNLKTSQGRETIDEFEKKEDQSVREYLAYVREMVKEYQVAGMAVYRSGRCCANWK